MGSDWFFSTWFTYRDSALPREPDWLREENENTSLRRDAPTNGQAPKAPKSKKER